MMEEQRLERCDVSRYLKTSQPQLSFQDCLLCDLQEGNSYCDWPLFLAPKLGYWLRREVTLDSLQNLQNGFTHVHAGQWTKTSITI